MHAKFRPLAQALTVAGLILGFGSAGIAAELVVLGIAQDAGHPQMGCQEHCCSGEVSHRVSSVAIIDGQRRFLLDATPDLPAQLRELDETFPVRKAGRDPGLDGIFLTHAHIGHYTGLMYFGHESMGTKGVKTYMMPKMANFLQTDGPWSQLFHFDNLVAMPLQADQPVELADDLSITPIVVPHRDEFSETVGYLVKGPRRSALYLPDINKWTQWDRDLAELLAEVDIAYLDGSFYTDGEIPGRSMADIPHPFMVETMATLAHLPASERAKVYFIHLNHTNPALDASSNAAKQIREAGYHIAARGDRQEL